MAAQSFQPQDLECILQGFDAGRNVCSLSGRWCSKSLTQDEYIDKFSIDSVLVDFSNGKREKPAAWFFCKAATKDKGQNLDTFDDWWLTTR
ncbi:unnamed protein product [Aspergillus oryzae]|uniref:Unnamed protein product n=1 Tax=Aspergillus oryzae TaxID=5062 RepID=A0AAN4YCK9_ASPOZ|nr:unnamed protein product [Aspergillus oryzae]GMG23674.1 unnamed protein product [Aspergillus oryzae]